MRSLMPLTVSPTCFDFEYWQSPQVWCNMNLWYHVIRKFLDTIGDFELENWCSNLYGSNPSCFHSSTPQRVSMCSLMDSSSGWSWCEDAVHIRQICVVVILLVIVHLGFEQPPVMRKKSLVLQRTRDSMAPKRRNSKITNNVQLPPVKLIHQPPRFTRYE
jgi:hypothetical protein